MKALCFYILDTASLFFFFFFVGGLRGCGHNKTERCRKRKRKEHVEFYLLKGWGETTRTHSMPGATCCACAGCQAAASSKEWARCAWMLTLGTLGTYLSRKLSGRVCDWNVFSPSSMRSCWVDYSLSQFPFFLIRKVWLCLRNSRFSIQNVLF